MALDGNIKALLKNTVSWERYSGQDKYGDPTYATAVTLSCWIEERAIGGVVVIRDAAVTTYDPQLDVYFDAGDANAQLIGERDRFTVGVEQAGGQRMEPDRINTVFNWLGQAWLIVVTL